MALSKAPLALRASVSTTTLDDVELLQLALEVQKRGWRAMHSIAGHMTNDVNVIHSLQPHVEIQSL